MQEARAEADAPHAFNRPPLLSAGDPKVPKGARPPSPMLSAGNPQVFRVHAVSKPCYKR